MPDKPTKKREYNSTGFKKELLDLAAKNGINYKTYYYRVKQKGWDEVEAAIAPPNDPLENLIKAREERRKHPKYYVDLAEKNGIVKDTFYNRMRKGWDIKKAATTPPTFKKGPGQKRKLTPNEYAVYRGDDYICSGTAAECAEFLGVVINSFYRYLTNTHAREQEGRQSKNAITVIRLDDDEDEEEESEAI